MSNSDRFVPASGQDVVRLVHEYPMAWIVTTHEGDTLATPLPLRPVCNDRDEIVELLGHFARRNPHVELLRRAGGRALVLFMGPQGYVSASWLSDRTQAPTWNYASAQFLVELEFVEDAGPTDEIMRDLVGAMESGRPRQWSFDEMGPRYARLASGIIAFRARILERRVKFKLGQDERDCEYCEITQALDSSGQQELLEWMQRCNGSRTAG